MSQIPTLKEIYDRLEADLKARLSLTNNELREVLSAFNAAISAEIWLHYQYVADVKKNLYPDTADLEINGGDLERHGRIQLNRNPRTATAGVYEATISAESNTVLRSNLTFKANENTKSPGSVYVLDLEKIATGTNDTIELRSLDLGPDFTLTIGDELTVTEPVIGLEEIVTITGVVTSPKAGETIPAYRQNILDAIQLEPQGGAKTDYRLWAADAQGVRKVYPYVKEGSAGVVQIYVEANELDSTDTLGTPSQALLNEVEEVLNFDPDDTRPLNERGRRPLTAILEILPISLVPVDVQIIGLQNNTTAIQDQIRSNIELYLKDVRPYIAGADLLRNKNDILYEANAQSVVVNVLEDGNVFEEILVLVNGVQSNTYLFSRENIPYLRNLNIN